MLTARAVNLAPSVSVVVPTYNRQGALGRVFDALDAQASDQRGFEVVVVNDGSTDGTRAWLDAQRRGFELRVIHQQNSGPAHARNAGVEAARAPLILFLDDDVEPSRELIREHIASHEQEADLVVMGPMASLPSYRQAWVAWEQAKLERQYTAMTRGDWQPTFRQFWTGNASVRREHVQAVGGFNPDFLRAEDVELGHRLHQRGLKFRFNPRARGLHHAQRSLASWERMHQSYGELEVRIFGMWDEAKLIQVLGDNWARLHPATRWLVRQGLESPRRHAALKLALRRWLELGNRLARPMPSEHVCSLLANLIYWRASVGALGPARAELVFRRAEERAHAA
jgi:glycosyltransferase involved in cell wall biosynthesis